MEMTQFTRLTRLTNTLTLNITYRINIEGIGKSGKVGNNSLVKSYFCINISEKQIVVPNFKQLGTTNWLLGFGITSFPILRGNRSGMFASNSWTCSKRNEIGWVGNSNQFFPFSSTQLYLSKLPYRITI